MKFTCRNMMSALASAALLISGPVLAQGSDRAVRIIVGYAPGGSADLLARTIQAPVAAALGQPVVIDNKAGALGVVAAIETSRAQPDGLTLLLSPVAPILQAPLITKNDSLQPLKMLQPVAGVASTPLVLVTNAAVPANDLPSFLEYARKQPTGVDVAVSGPSIQVATALLASETKTNFVSVPYRGQAPALQAVLSNEVKLFINTPSAAMFENVRSGKLKIVAMTGAESSALVPGVQPVASVVPGFSSEIMFALFAPPNTPKDVVAKLAAAVQSALSAPGVSEKFVSFGLATRSMGPEALARQMVKEHDELHKVMQRTKISFE